ncbi:MAG: hypothetical protein KAG66_00595 [Methylococcales bacterium]|nr:hypothetical protein [Methylococcales bacterium]
MEKEKSADCERMISALIFLSENLNTQLAHKIAVEAGKNNYLALRCLNIIRRMSMGSWVSESDIFALVGFIEQKNLSFRPKTETLH